MKTNLKVILISFGPLIAIVILFAVSGKFAFGKISEVRLKIAGEKKNETILKQKLDLLTDLEAEVLSDSSISLSALPGDNPSLVVVAQLKNIASETNVLLASIKTGVEVKGEADLSNVNISFEATGARQDILEFLERIENIAPLSLVNKIQLNESSGIMQGDISVKSFWAPPPEKLPSFETAISDLTDDERQTLVDILGLTQPLFLKIPAESSPGRIDPFGT